MRRIVKASIKVHGLHHKIDGAYHRLRSSCPRVREKGQDDRGTSSTLWSLWV